MNTTLTRRTLAKAGIAAAAITGLAACNGGGDEGDEGGGSEGGGDGQTLTVWTPHNTPQRLAVQEEVAARFTEETGIAVSLVGMAGPDMNTSIVAGAASGDVPDVALVAVDQVASWHSQGLIDPSVADAVVSELGAETFSEDALNQVTLADEVAAVPSDAWGELLYYRTDVFEQHGLAAPQTVQDVVAAAEAITAGDSGMVGIVLGTTPADPLTREHVEYLGLANGAAMFDGSEVSLNSGANVENFTNFQSLANASVAGDQDTESTRAAYLNGDAAMVLWSPHLLDEIANLDENFPVSAPEAGEDPLFLAKNTAVVGGLGGVDNSEPTTFGSVLSYVSGTGSNTEAATQYIQFLLSDGYIETLAMTPEGRTPVRTGTAENPTQYVDEWAELPIGTNPDNQMPLAEAFTEDTVEQISTAANVFGRWGFGTENWATAGAAVSQNTVVLDLQNLLPDGDPQAYADSVQAAVEQLHAENQ